jgi:hypothetical protein
MLTSQQLAELTPEQLNEYNEADAEGKAQFEYFYGFTFSNTEVKQVVKQEVALYQKITDSIKLKDVARLLSFVPHKGQQPVFYTIDEQKDIINNIVMVLGRRARKKYKHISSSFARATSAL